MLNKNISVTEIAMNPFDLIGNEWMLLTAGNKEQFNTMTASWGFAGVMWGVNAIACVVRPQRYTNEFMQKSDYFTASFFGKGNHRDALALCGSKSGRDIDKVAETGLTPAFFNAECRNKNAEIRNDNADSGIYVPYFEEAEKVFICRKLYEQKIDPAGFRDPEINKNYAAGDYHIMYIGEIVDSLES